jgi:uncharacterized repeat protein (TIGR03803 family)
LFHGCGVVYKVDPSGKQTVLHTFVGHSDGRQPYFGNLFRDNTGNLFGTTVYGGMKGDIGIGVAYKVAKTGQETVLHHFTGGGEDGQQPVAGLILDSDGNFYGTTVAGGSANDGTVYRMSKSGKVTVLHSFTGSDGVEPTGWLTQDTAGNLYGTAITGGSTGQGTVFKITKTGTFTLLYTFKGAPDGGLPQGNLVIDKAGNIYGATGEGGDAESCPYFGCGVAFKIDTHGKEQVLHEFLWAEGCNPSGGLISDAAGNLYGADIGPAEHTTMARFSGWTKRETSPSSTTSQEGQTVDSRFPHCPRTRPAIFTAPRIWGASQTGVTMHRAAAWYSS